MMNHGPIRTSFEQSMGLALGVVSLGACAGQGCSVYTDSILDDAQAASSDLTEPAESAGGIVSQPATGGSSVVGAGGTASGGVGSGGAGSGGVGSGGQASMGGETSTGACAIAPLTEPSTLPDCSDQGYVDPKDADLCSAGDDCRTSSCGFAALGTKVCTCKADGTFNCTCARPEAYEGACPEGTEGCSDLNRCVRAPSCVELDLENEGAARGTRSAMHGDICASEWDQCVTVDAPASDGCVCLRVTSAVPQWVCKDRENWFEAL